MDAKRQETSRMIGPKASRSPAQVWSTMTEAIWSGWAKFNMEMNQWDFQDPKLEVPTIYKAYVRPM